LKVSREVEARIAELLEAGDFAGASEAALRAYGPGILVWLRSALRDDDLAGDVFSRFAEKLWKSAADFRGESSFATWTYRLAWFAVKEHQRAEGRRREERLTTSAVSKIVEQVKESTFNGMRTDARDRWAKIKEGLDPFERALLLLRVEQQLPWKDVARILSDEGEAMTEGALRKRFERLRTKLHELAREAGLY
jgi:RNA polymerase sigma-70 factor (ECF subfamily)